MLKRMIGLVGAITALGLPQAVQAGPVAPTSANEMLKVSSYAELLDPIPNAASVLMAVDETSVQSPARVEKVQWHHHHHHHSHWWWRRRWYHHHHHHHHHWYHHHHHHHHYW